MNYKVRALDTYKTLKIKDKVLKTIPEKGFEFEVDEERMKVLTGDNRYNAKFVELVKTKKKKQMPESKIGDVELVAVDVPIDDQIFHHGEPIPVPVDPTIKDK